MYNVIESSPELWEAGTQSPHFIVRETGVPSVTQLGNDWIWALNSGSLGPESICLAAMLYPSEEKQSKSPEGKGDPGKSTQRRLLQWEMRNENKLGKGLAFLGPRTHWVKRR